jgi:hypothetical protein
MHNPVNVELRVIEQAAAALGAYMEAVRYAQDRQGLMAAIRQADEQAQAARTALFQAVVRPADHDRMVTEPVRAPLTPTSAHPALVAASEYADACAAVEAHRFGTAGYYEAIAVCDKAWEAIAAACNVGDAVLIEVVKWALNGHIGSMGATEEACQAIRAAAVGPGTVPSSGGAKGDHGGQGGGNG